MKAEHLKNPHFRTNIVDASKISQYCVVFIRHGESTWNSQSKFAGWADVHLTEKGVQQARKAGQSLKERGFEFDICFTSYLARAIETCHFATKEMNALHIPQVKAWELNEKHYGQLQGMTKASIIEKFGEEATFQLRKGYQCLPPLLEEDDERRPINDKKYKNVPTDKIPRGESLKMAMERVWPYWQQKIVPEVQKGKKVLYVGHQNVIRGIIKQLDGISDEDIMRVSIPNGIPLVYQFDKNMKKLQHFYMLDPKIDLSI